VCRLAACVRVARVTGSHFVLQNWQRAIISVGASAHRRSGRKGRNEFLLLLLILLRVRPRHRHAGLS
jgi:hypothetical protein